jgi:5-formyltetrahydrofolate cyclo-ligase
MGIQAATTESKSDLRRRLIDSRRTLSPAERRDRSRRVCDACGRLPPYSRAPLICSYIGFGEEVESADLVRSLLQARRRVAVPTQRAPGGKPSFALVRAWDDLSPNSLGLLEPAGGRLDIVPTASIGLFFVPGVAFDAVGGRLGYGLGFYDHALAGASATALKIGLAFDLQIVDKVPLLKHDVCMDMIITESRVINASPGARNNEEVC